MPLSNYSDFFFEDDRTVVVNSEDEPQDFCEEVRVTDVFVNLTDTTRKVRVEVKTPIGVNGEWIGPASALTGTPIKLLTDYGLHLSNTPDYSLTLSEVLQETEKDAKVWYSHTGLGWHTFRGKKCFLASKAVGAEVQSTYLYPEKVESKGSYDEWQFGMRSLIKGNPKIQFALAIGASAMLVPMLQERGLLVGSIVVAFTGKSSQSKTTMLKTIAGIYGRSEIGYMVETLNDTENYTVETLADKRGFVHCIDEISVKDDASNLVYFFSQGKSRGRCNPDGSMKKPRTWSTTIVLTGEKNILEEQTNGALGLKARVLPIDLCWTDTPALSEAIAAFNSRCYGVAYEPLAEFILDTPEDSIVDAFTEVYEKFAVEIKAKTGVEHRLAKMYATILLAADIMAKAWDFPIDMNAIKELLLQAHESNERVKNPADSIYESLKSQLAEKADKIIDEKSKINFATNAIAIKGKHGGLPVLWLKKPSFDTMVHKAGESNANVAREQLFEAGYLYRPYGRWSVSKKFFGISVHCDCLAIKETADHTKPKAKKRYRRKVKKELMTKMPELLAPDDDD